MPSSARDRMPSTVLVFLKAPRIGRVKTRLAKNIGLESALKVYRSLVERQLGELSPNDPVEIHYAPADALEEMHDWLGNGYDFYPQCEGGLGLRLEHAVSEAFARGAKSVICIGGDCPSLNYKHLKQASVALQRDHDVVFGPSEDGGYYLVGIHEFHVELFQNIPWSTETTLEESMKKSMLLGLRVKSLETLYDIDEINELNRAFDQGLLSVELKTKQT